jgi:hypothetical protein
LLQISFPLIPAPKRKGAKTTGMLNFICIRCTTFFTINPSLTLFNAIPFEKDKPHKHSKPPEVPFFYQWPNSFFQILNRIPIGFVKKITNEKLSFFKIGNFNQTYQKGVGKTITYPINFKYFRKQIYFIFRNHQDKSQRKILAISLWLLLPKQIIFLKIFFLEMLSLKLQTNANLRYPIIARHGTVFTTRQPNCSSIINRSNNTTDGLILYKQW